VLIDTNVALLTHTAHDAPNGRLQGRSLPNRNSGAIKLSFCLSCVVFTAPRYLSRLPGTFETQAAKTARSFCVTYSARFWI